MHVLLLVEVSHGLGCCKDSTRQNKSGKCKAYCTTATTRKSGERVADHMGHSFGRLRWVGVVGELIGNVGSATWAMAAQCFKANVNRTVHLPHLGIINTFTVCFELLYSRKGSQLWSVHKQGRKVSAVKSVKSAFSFPSVGKILWATAYTFSSLVGDHKHFGAWYILPGFSLGLGSQVLNPRGSIKHFQGLTYHRGWGHDLRPSLPLPKLWCGKHPAP